MSRRSDALRLLGLARRAGAVLPGTEATRRALRSGEARLIVMAGDASQTQMKKLDTTSGEGRVPRVVLGDRAELGAAIGRGPVSAVAVTADTFARQLVRGLAAHEKPDGPEDGREACGS